MTVDQLEHEGLLADPKVYVRHQGVLMEVVVGPEVQLNVSKAIFNLFLGPWGSIVRNCYRDCC